MIEGVRTYVVQYPPFSELSLRIELLGAIDVIKFLSVMNSVVSLSSFVNISAMLIFPSICLMETVLLDTDSLIAFSLIVICLRPLVVVDFDQQTHALLSLYTWMGSLFGV